jgi:hypothetical protein
MVLTIFIQDFFPEINNWRDMNMDLLRLLSKVNLKMN